MHSGNSLNLDNPAFSIALGIASLIIEGRPLFDDEYVLDSNQEHRNDSYGQNFVRNFFPALNQSSSPFSLIDTKIVDLATRKSNIDITSTPVTSTFSSKSDSVKHLERLRQKLHQLRSLPSTSRDIAEQIIDVSSTEATTSNETELDGELEVIFKRRSLPITSTIDKSSKSINALQLFVPTGISLQRTPRSLIEHNGLLQTVTSWTDSKFSPEKFSTPSTSSASNLTSPSSASSAASFVSPSTSSFSLKQEKRKGKILGPHCEQFLAKIGLMKSTSNSEHSIEIDRHECLPNNETCFRWQQCYNQLIPILARGEPICIEVYLGPENHVILLEQWIIEQNSVAGRFSMTIQSLCTAIRSQLHFSQITAWSDLLKVTSPFDNDLKSNPRIKSTPFQQKLDILYRIRPYTEASTSCFSATPLVHNFPEIFLNDQLSLKVSLKSLPRMKSIPSLYDPNVMDGNLLNVTTTLQSIIVDNRQDFGCSEKGKHRCSFDEESPTDDATSHRDKQLLKYKKRLLRRDKKKRHEDSIPSNTNRIMETNSNTITKTRSDDGTTIKNGSITQYDQTINPNKPPLYSSMSIDDTEPCKHTINPNSNLNSNITMSIGSDDQKSIHSIESSFNNNNNNVNIQISSMLTKSTQTTAIEMTSIGTQTDDGQIVFHKCDFCGIEMQYFCWNCDKRMFYNGSADSQLNFEKSDLLLKAIQRTPLAVQQTNNIKMNRVRCSATDNAIESTYSVGQQLELNNNHKNNNNNNNNNNVICRVPAMIINNNNNNNNINNNNKNMTPNHLCDESSDKYNCDNYSNISKDELDLGDTCCKRKKTMHNYYRDPNTNAIIGSHSINNSPSRNLSRDDLFVTQHGHDECSGSYRRTMSESVVGTCHTDIENYTQPGIDITACDTMNILSDNELKLYRRAYSEDELICNCDDNRPKQLDLNKMNSPPTQHQHQHQHQHQRQHQHDFPLTMTTTQLCLAADEQTDSQFKTPINKHLSTSYDHQTKPIYIDCHNRNDDDDNSQDSLSTNVVKILPKINLTKLFADSMETSPTDILTENQFDVEKELRKRSQGTLPKFSLKFDFEHLSPPLASPVMAQNWRSQIHKSNSAPSYSPPALSPRFLKSVKAAAATKRRSRHLSDRSMERLSFGSDDHFSDEDFCTEYRPGISPNKASLRFFPKNYAYRKRALLGSFEESLLQRRFEPKFLVPGYKVLLGASGCYCTNQITIPAYTFFYEMNAETLSTPYVCEVSMPPRKGYVIPRTGHVQATLLNPNGMVVRMFVVQYDFRDMPPMCQTFVRQRILSFDENANPGQSVDDLSPSEQMKLLRYAIHLRFQTTRSGRLSLHGDIRMLISRRTDCDTAAAHAKGTLESPSELKTVTIIPENPKFSPR